MTDRAIVTQYDIDSYGDPVQLYIRVYASYCRNTFGGTIGRDLDIPITSSDTITQIGQKIIAAIRADAVDFQFDFSQPGSILLPDYTKV